MFDPPVISIAGKIDYIQLDNSDAYIIAKGYDFVLPEFIIDSDDSEEIKLYLNNTTVESLTTLNSDFLNEEGSILIYVEDSIGQRSNSIVINYIVKEELVLSKGWNTDAIPHTDVLSMQATNEGLLFFSKSTQKSPLARLEQGTSSVYNLSLLSNDFRLLWSVSFDPFQYNLVGFEILENSNILLYGSIQTNTYCNQVSSNGLQGYAIMLDKEGNILDELISRSGYCDSVFIGAFEINNKIIFLSDVIVDDTSFRFSQLNIEVYSNDISSFINSNALYEQKIEYKEHKLFFGNPYLNGHEVQTNRLPLQSNDIYFVLSNRLFQVGQDGEFKGIYYKEKLNNTSTMGLLNDDIFNQIATAGNYCSSWGLSPHFDGLYLNSPRLIFTIQYVQSSTNGLPCPTPQTFEEGRAFIENGEIVIGSYILIFPQNSVSPLRATKEMFLMNESIHFITTMDGMPSRDTDRYLLFGAKAIYLLDYSDSSLNVLINYGEISGTLSKYDRIPNLNFDIEVFEEWSGTSDSKIEFTIPVAFDIGSDIIVPSRIIMAEKMRKIS